MENGYRNKSQKEDINENKEILLTVSMKWVIKTPKKVLTVRYCIQGVIGEGLLSD